MVMLVNLSSFLFWDQKRNKPACHASGRKSGEAEKSFPLEMIAAHHSFSCLLAPYLPAFRFLPSLLSGKRNSDTSFIIIASGTKTTKFVLQETIPQN